MSQVKSRKTVRKIIFGIIAVIILLSAVIVGMCLFNERPAVQSMAVYQDLYSDVQINTADDGGV